MSEVCPPDCPCMTKPPRSETILDEAARLTSQDRQQSYGNPLDDFTCSGRQQAAIVERFLRQTVPNLPLDFRVPDFPAEISVLLMQPVKISREVHLPKRDNRVDGAGYWRLVEMIHDERERREKEMRAGAHVGIGGGVCYGRAEAADSQLFYRPKLGSALMTTTAGYGWRGPAPHSRTDQADGQG